MLDDSNSYCESEGESRKPPPARGGHVNAIILDQRYSRHVDDHPGNVTKIVTVMWMSMVMILMETFIWLVIAAIVRILF